MDMAYPLLAITIFIVSAYISRILFIAGVLSARTAKMLGLVSAISLPHNFCSGLDYVQTLTLYALSVIFWVLAVQSINSILDQRIAAMRSIKLKAPKTF